MIVGFTGTRKGMNERQQNQLALMLQALRTEGSGGPDGYSPIGSNVFHFGGAHGADLLARKLAKPFGYDIEWHPVNPALQNKVLKGKKPLAKRPGAVMKPTHLKAAPAEPEHKARGHISDAQLPSILARHADKALLAGRKKKDD